MATKKGSKKSTGRHSGSSTKTKPELSSEDAIIADLLTRVVKSDLIPRELRRFWRQPYNAHALLLRSKVRDLGWTTKDDRIGGLVEEWVAEERRKSALRAQGIRA